VTHNHTTFLFELLQFFATANSYVNATRIEYSVQLYYLADNRAVPAYWFSSLLVRFYLLSCVDARSGFGAQWERGLRLSLMLTLLGAKNKDPRLIRVISLQVTQPIRPWYVTVTNEQTDRQTT